MGTVGRIEVICGPMFAGKTEELLRRVRRAVIAGRRVVVVGHSLDDRHGANRLASHVGLDHSAVMASSAADIERAVPAGAAAGSRYAEPLMAELDSERRTRLAELVAGAEQVLVTAAVPEDVPTALSGLRVDVVDGQVAARAD